MLETGEGSLHTKHSNESWAGLNEERGPEQLQSHLKAKSWGPKQLLKMATKTSENGRADIEGTETSPPTGC